MDCFYIKTFGDTSVTLAERLDIENYGCGLLEISGQLTPSENEKILSKHFFLCSDISEEVFINNIKLPILRTIKFDKNWEIDQKFNKIIWLRVIREPVSKITLYITDENGKRVSFKGEGLMCTLLLLPNKLHR